MECRFIWEHTWWRKSDDTPILFSMSTAKFVCATWSLGFSTWIIWILYALRRSLLCSTSCTIERGTCYCKLAAWTDLCGLRWNASLMRSTFSSEVHSSRRFYMQQTTCCPRFVVPGPNTFPCRRMTSILHSKTKLTAIRDCNSASTTHTEPVPVVSTLLLSSPKVTSRRMRVNGHEKNFQSFPFRWHKLDTCMTISFQDINFLFSIHFIQTPCNIHQFTATVTKQNLLVIKHYTVSFLYGTSMMQTYTICWSNWWEEQMTDYST
jgi:hypothetical protein